MPRKYIPAFALITALIFFGLSQASAAVYTVTKTADTNDGVCDTDCSLREAITAANAAGSLADDMIIFSQGLSDTPIIVTAGELPIINSGSLAILGFGADHLTIASSGGPGRIFFLDVSAVATVTGMTLKDGHGDGSWGISGGAIHSRGTLTVDGAYFNHNDAFNSPNGGGAIFVHSTGPTDIRNSAFYDNGATAGPSLRCDSTGPVAITNSTFDPTPSPFGNRDNRIELRNCTITVRNSTLADAWGGFGGLFFFGNSVVRNINGSSGNVISDGNNIIVSTTGTVSLQSSDRVGIDPMLGPVQNNGGKTPTRALLAGSPAIDMGSNSLASGLMFDQRGFARVVDGNGDTSAVVDIGAYEFLAPAPAAGNVSITGQVMNAGGTPIFRAAVTLTDARGNTFQALTNSFGYYTFSNISPGEYCAITVAAKRGRFAMKVVNSGQGLSDVNFTSN